MKFDFSGYASKADLLCSDGRTIKPHAFKDDDGKEVPIYLEHRRTGVKTELGRAILEDREDGTYVYGTFNDTPEGRNAKKAVKDRSINGLSVRATDLIHRGADVIKGVIEEVSLVLKGANPGASIQNVSIAHSSGYSIELDDEAIIYTGLALEHSDLEGEDMDDKKDMSEKENGGGEKTIRDVLETLNEEQRKAVAYLIEQLTNSGEEEGSESDDEKKETSKSKDDKSEKPKSEDDSEVSHAKKSEDMEDDEETTEEVDLENPEDGEKDPEDDKKKTLAHSDKESKMGNKRNIFESSNNVNDQRDTLSHSQMQEIFSDALRSKGSLREVFLEHANEYGFENIDVLFPDAKTLSSQPEILSRRTEWVDKVLGPVRKSPFARVKSIVADITADEARARGYVKGSLKKEEIIKLLKRKTDPTTVYKKQKIDRDDLIDITDIDTVAFLKAEMRLMLDEELARAILVGDGRPYEDESKIDEEAIRPIASDEDMYAEKVVLPSNTSIEDRMEAMIRARASYRGTGTPTLYTTLSFITDMLLLKDRMGRRLYSNLDELASELMANEIVPVEVLETYPTIAGIYVNMADYTLGSDRGGEISFFDDFDIDYNQHKYLLETRCSGALTKPKSAIVIKLEEGISATPVSPSFDGETNTITIPNTEGIDYKVDGVVKTGKVTISKNAEVTATAKKGYFIPGNTVTNWTFIFTGK